MVAGKPVFRNILVGMRPKTRDSDLPSPHDVEVFIHNSFAKRIENLKTDIKVRCILSSDENVGSHGFVPSRIMWRCVRTVLLGFRTACGD